MKKAIWINGIVGLWLLAAPFVITFGHINAVWAANDVILGLLLILCSFWISASPTPAIGMSWFEVICGIWLVLSPFVLGYTAVGGAVANDVIAGVVAILVSAIVTSDFTRHPLAG